MKTTNDFTVGERVKMYDSEDGCNVYGHVVDVKPNQVPKLSSIVVKWNDLSDLCEHYQEEFEKIKPGLPNS
jgi:hypothetical protein